MIKKILLTSFLVGLLTPLFLFGFQPKQGPVGGKHANLNQMEHTHSFKVHPTLPQFNLHIERDEDNPTFIFKLRRGKDKEPFQTFNLTLYETNPFNDLQTIDLNFDGFLDILIPENTGPAGATSYYAWLYKSKKGLFKQTRIECQNCSFDDQRKRIVSNEMKLSACSVFCSHTAEYMWRGEDLILMREIWDGVDPETKDANCRKTIYENRRGEMQLISNEMADWCR